LTAAPLAGLLVVDLSRYLPGPLAGRLLRDLGARVVKVEEPELGDPLRQSPPFRARRSTLAALLLAGLESVALDLKRAPARAVLRQLLAGADVLLESFRPGTLARLGLAPAELRQELPRLVICSVSGWGQDGPHAARAGHDLTYQAAAGGLAATQSMPAMPAADLLGAWSAVASVLAALHQRERTGEGAWIDASLYDAAVHGNLMSWAALAGGAVRPGRPGTLSGALPCYQLYRTCDDRQVALAMLEPRFWRRFCARVGRRDLRRLQYAQGAEPQRIVAELIAGRDAEQWRQLFAAEDLPAEVVEEVGAARFHPQARARGLFSIGGDGGLELAFPARFDGERPVAAGEWPELGADTNRCLAAAGSPLGAASHGAQRRAGVGRRWTLRSVLWRLGFG